MPGFSSRIRSRSVAPANATIDSVVVMASIDGHDAFTAVNVARRFAHALLDGCVDGVRCVRGAGVFCFPVPTRPRMVATPSNDQRDDADRVVCISLAGVVR